MEFVDNLNSYIIILVYPDGYIEKIVKDERIFHMEYMVSLINRSSRLKDIIKKNNIYIPTDETEIKYTMTYELDTELAKKGIISFHNLLTDLDTAKEFEDLEKVFHITLPTSLTDKQKEIMNKVITNNDLSESWFGILVDNAIYDMAYDDMKELINDKTK